MTSQEIHLLWAPPTNFTLKPLIQNDSPDLNAGDADTASEIHEKTDPDTAVLGKDVERQADAPINDATDASKDNFKLAKHNVIQKRLKDDIVGIIDYKTYDPSLADWYGNERVPDKFSEVLSDDPNRSRRDIWYSSRRHRKRRQEAISSNPILSDKSSEIVEETHQALDVPEAAKRSFGSAPPKRAQLAYVLYYEQGVQRPDTATVMGVPSSKDVKRMYTFASDLGMAEYSKATKNLTLLNKAGEVTEVVGFHLKNLSEYEMI